MSSIHLFDVANGGKSKFGSLEKSIKIHELVQVKRELRDGNWVQSFLDNIDECNLELGTPEVSLGSDGYPYMCVSTVEADSNFKAFVIQNQLDTMIPNGFGLVINYEKDMPDWVFSFGDLLNLKINGEFYTDKSAFSVHGGDFVIPQDEEVLIGQPSDTILPDIARKHIREYLQSVNLNEAKMCLLLSHYGDEEEMRQDLVFNITPKTFDTEAKYLDVMNTIAWFLPKHYSIVGLDEKNILNKFDKI